MTRRLAYPLDDCLLIIDQAGDVEAQPALDRTSLAVLRAISIQPLTLTEISLSLPISYRYTLVIVSRLAGRGLIDTHRNGRGLEIMPAIRLCEVGNCE